MNYSEYSIVSTKSYIDYCNYLLEKYGVVNGDYFSASFAPNISIKRRDENLFVHHMREDKIANLSNVDSLVLMILSIREHTILYMLIC